MARPTDIDELLALVHVDPPPTVAHAQAHDAAFAAAWDRSTSVIAMMLALEHPDRARERAAVVAVVQALDAAGLGGRPVARLADLQRRARDGTLGAYNGPAFDRARTVAGRLAVWERGEATPDHLRAACDVIRAASPSRPRFEHVAKARAR